MMQIRALSRLTGLSVRTLQYYDRIGLLRPAAVTEAGYRLYDEASLERLQQILLFRELEFPLKQIRHILDAPDFDRSKALEQQITLLTMKRDRLNDLIRLAQGIRLTGGTPMEFSAFDTKQLEEYRRQAQESWGGTQAFQEFQARSADAAPEQFQDAGEKLMELLAVFGSLKDRASSDPVVQAQVKKLQDFITDHFYTCTDKILADLGRMYADGGDFTKNIDRAGGPGTANFAAAAIQAYVR
ncbi:MAG: MerR family transcriptional regulator [Oscillospiraceae bacterium]|nr:MerR family transcriptional regulator [Oscillospiraceae bacterium]